MTRKKAVDELQFDFGLDAEAEVAVVVDLPRSEPSPAAPISSPGVPGPARVGRLPGLDRRSEGIRQAFEALESGRPPGPSEVVDYDATFPETSYEGLTSEAALSITAFYDRLRFALRQEFPDEIWVTGEIRKVNVSKGHRYIELADHEPSLQGGRDGNRQQSSTLDVACWSRDWPGIAASLESVGIELAAGLVVRIRGKVSVWDAGARIRFSMTDLDVEALVGGIAAARRKLLAALEAEGVINANKRLPVPAVPLRIGLVTSAGSEAYRDFTGQLERSGYKFVTRFESSLVQGPDAPQLIGAAIGRLQLHPLDLVVVIRGGGAKGDLAAFDHEAVARAIVGSRYPVWTGIGHTGDRSVADEVAHRALVTPTAVGEAVVDVVAGFVATLEAQTAAVLDAASRAMERTEHKVAASRSTLVRAAQHELSRADSGIASARGRIARSATSVVERCSTALARRADAVAAATRNSILVSSHGITHQRTRLDSFDLRTQMRRGWSLTRRADGSILRSVGGVEAGELLTTIVADGTVSSTTIGASVDTGPERTSVTRENGDRSES